MKIYASELAPRTRSESNSPWLYIDTLRANLENCAELTGKMIRVKQLYASHGYN